MALPPPPESSESESYDCQFDGDNEDDPNDYFDDVMSVKSVDSVATNATAIFDQIFAKYQSNMPPNAFGSIAAASPMAAKHVSNKQDIKPHQTVTMVPSNMPPPPVIDINNYTAPHQQPHNNIMPPSSPVVDVNNYTAHNASNNSNNNMQKFESLSQINGMNHGNTARAPVLSMKRSSSAKNVTAGIIHSNNKPQHNYVQYQNYSNPNGSMSPRTGNNFSNTAYTTPISPRSHLIMNQRPKIYQTAKSNPGPNNNNNNAPNYNQYPQHPTRNRPQTLHQNINPNSNVNPNANQNRNRNQTVHQNRNQNINQNINMNSNANMNQNVNNYNRNGHQNMNQNTYQNGRNIQQNMHQNMNQHVTRFAHHSSSKSSPNFRPVNAPNVQNMNYPNNAQNMYNSNNRNNINNTNVHQNNFQFSQPNMNNMNNTYTRNSINNINPNNNMNNMNNMNRMNLNNNVNNVNMNHMNLNNVNPYSLPQSMSPSSSLDDFGAKQFNSRPTSPNIAPMHINNINNINNNHHASFVPPSPIQNISQIHSYPNTNTNTNTNPAAHSLVNPPATASASAPTSAPSSQRNLNTNSNASKPGDAFISLWDEHNSSEELDEQSDESFSSHSVSWNEQQKLTALTAFSTIDLNVAAPTPTTNEPHSPQNKYISDAIFNIKKYNGNTPDNDEQNLPELPEEDDPDVIQLQEIIWSVTNPYNTDKNGSKIRDVLLLCHPIFTESIDILDLLQKRFLQRDDEIDDGVHWQIQSKVAAFLQAWIRAYYYQDFELYPDEQMKIQMKEFIRQMRDYFQERKTNKIFAKGYMLPDMIERSMKAQNGKMRKLGLDKHSRKMSKAVKLLGADEVKSNYNDKNKQTKKKEKKNDAKYNKKFLNEDNKKIAQQLTLLAFERFKAIQARECLNQNWKKQDKELRAPNICKNVELFNDISKYISMTILSLASIKQRSKCIKKWINIGSECFELHNFESLAAIQGTLTSNAIYKLKKEWKSLPQKYMNKFKEFKVIYSRNKNSRNLRKIMSVTPPPMIPYTGVFLQDLFVTEEAKKTKMKDGTINFTKLMTLHSLIQRIQLLQNTKYSSGNNNNNNHHQNGFKVNENVKQFLITGIGKYKHLTSKEIYKISVSITKPQQKK